MRPGGFASAGLLAPAEKLEAVIARDNESLRKLGVTHEQIADRAEALVGQADRIANLARAGRLRIDDDAVAAFTDGTGPGILIEDRYAISGVSWRGFQSCPFQDEAGQLCEGRGLPGHDLSILDTSTGRVLQLPGLLVHLIRDHHFFEGSVPHRIDPEGAAAFLEVVPGEDYAPSRRTEWVWSARGGSEQKYSLDAETKALIVEHERAVVLSDETQLCVRGNRCVAVVKEDACGIPDGFMLDGAEWTMRPLPRGYWAFERVEVSYVVGRS